MLLMSSIIVVYGMNLRGNEEHEENNWTDQNTGTYWAKTLLPQQTPNARIRRFITMQTWPSALQ